MHNLALLLARLVLGVTMIAHGWQKYTQGGVAGTREGFTQMGIPMPGIAAPATIFIEIFGGIAVILGLLLPLVGVAYAVVMAGALALVHLPNGFYAGNGGYELVLLLGAFALALAGTGAGRYSLDHALVGHRRDRKRLRQDQDDDGDRQILPVAPSSAKR